MLAWRVRPSAKSGYRTHGTFCVARLLLEDRLGRFPPRTRIASICGLSQCVNPDHWRPVISQPVWRVAARADGAWQLVRVASGVPTRRMTVVHARVGGVVHVLQVLPADQRSLIAPPRAACGLELVPEMIVVTKDAVTCTEGC